MEIVVVTVFMAQQTSLCCATPSESTIMHVAILRLQQHI